VIALDNAEMPKEGNCTEYRELQKHLSRQKKEDTEGMNACDAEEQTQILKMKDEGIKSVGEA